MDKFDVVECRIVPFLESALNERTRIQAFLFLIIILLKKFISHTCFVGFSGFSHQPNTAFERLFFSALRSKMYRLDYTIHGLWPCFFPVLLLTGSAHLDPRFLRSFSTFKPSRIFLVPKDLGFLATTLRFTFYLLSFPVLKTKFKKPLFSLFLFLSLIYRIVLLWIFQLFSPHSNILLLLLSCFRVFRMFR